MRRIHSIARIGLLFIPVLFLAWTHAGNGGLPYAGKYWAPTDSVDQAAYIGRKIAFRDKYSFLDYDHNYIQWANSLAVNNFFEKLKNSRQQKVKVVHIGDSHVQADIGTGHIRNLLQDVFGPGGRGLIFPYATAKTHPGVDYQTYSYGKWTSARNVQLAPQLPLGTTGVSARTEDQTAVFKIVFNRYYNDVNARVLKIFCDASEQTFDLKLRYGTDPADTLTLRPHHRPQGAPYLLAHLPKSPGMLECSMLKANDRQRYFQLYGISLETEDDAGILYHSVGINGAAFGHVLKQGRMEEELGAIQPDLVVIDLAGNEFYLGLDETSFRERLTQVVKVVRQAAPAASILITCSQDIYRSYYVNIGEAERAAEISKEVAFANNCAFYDYYHITGGRYSMLKWRSFQLAKQDRIHLTYEGYQLKGELFANALLTSYHQYLLGYYQMPFVAESLPTPRFSSSPKVAPYQPVQTPSLPATATASTYTPPSPPAGVKAQYYTVQSGDVLGSIAEKYGVSVYQLRVWNGISGNLIRVGQRLTVYSNQAVSQAPAAAAQNPSPAAVARSTGAYHTVQAGETLYGISRRYGVSVSAIMQLNGLRGSDIRPGQRLRVK
ncbi:MAG: LysM peptidoglycan-binding domain-containing protein [Bacteroidetes bacterium]|nr:LysM peptidoglycan-binding domain-containing protein [Bacteroidota bacterium]